MKKNMVNSDVQKGFLAYLFGFMKEIMAWSKKFKVDHAKKLIVQKEHGKKRIFNVLSIRNVLFSLHIFPVG